MLRRRGSHSDDQSLPRTVRRAASKLNQCAAEEMALQYQTFKHCTPIGLMEFQEVDRSRFEAHLGTIFSGGFRRLPLSCKDTGCITEGDSFRSSIGFK